MVQAALLEKYGFEVTAQFAADLIVFVEECMSLERMGAQARHLYRVHPDDPTLAQWRKNRPGARWKKLGQYDSAEEARQAVTAAAQIDRGEVMDGAGG